MVLVERSVRGRNLLKRKCAVNMDLERATLNESIQFVDRFAPRLSVVGIDSHPCGRFGYRLHPVWMSNTAASSDRRQSSISVPTARGNQGCIDAVWCKLASHFQDVITATIRRRVCT